MILHDFFCPTCGNIEYDVICDGQFRKNCTCGSMMEIHYSPKRTVASVHPKERSVIWYNPETGKHATPGRNDVPMPERYRRAGYVRREFESLRSLDSYCKHEGLVNEKANYNSGNAYDD